MLITNKYNNLNLMINHTIVKNADYYLPGSLFYISGKQILFLRPKWSLLPP